MMGHRRLSWCLLGIYTCTKGVSRRPVAEYAYREFGQVCPAQTERSSPLNVCQNVNNLAVLLQCLHSVHGGWLHFLSRMRGVCSAWRAIIDGGVKGQHVMSIMLTHQRRPCVHSRREGGNPDRGCLLCPQVSGQTHHPCKFTIRNITHRKTARLCLALPVRVFIPRRIFLTTRIC